MKQGYLRFYDHYSARAPLRFLCESLFARPSARKHSLLNRMKDYYRLQGNPKLMALHREVNRILHDSANQWGSYDYGEGYCYQSLDLIGISGLRNTRARVEAMGLGSLLHGKTAIDVGCNVGFLALALAGVARKIIGLDVNPYLIDIGRAATAYLRVDNVDLRASAFEGFSGEGPVDAVLSFANHSTFDGNTKQTLEQYFAKCRALVAPDGVLLFESHHPEYEGKSLGDVCAIIGSQFQILDRKVLDYGTRLDRGRTFIVARPRPGRSTDTGIG